MIALAAVTIRHWVGAGIPAGVPARSAGFARAA